jgi:hypothetical protein
VDLVTESSSTDAIVARILDGQAPLNLRSAAARGALPLPRETLVRLQVSLLEDAEADVAQAARSSLDALDPAALQDVLGDPSCTGEVLTHFAKRASREDALAERIAFHPSVPLPALAVLATAGNVSVLELVLTNQELLLSRPGLLEKLMLNPALRVDQRGRILELLERAAELEEAKAETGGDDDAELEELSLDEAARLLEVDVGELMSASEILGGEEFEQSEDPEVRSTYRKILMLNAAQKAILAMRGGREERLILVRDSNRTVAMGVLKNGRLTEGEVEIIAKMRNVVDDVLRQIATSREWTKSYGVIQALLNNPRTPPSVSTNFVNRLGVPDLKRLTINRDVPELIRRMARRTLDVRAQRQRVTFKRK